MSEDNPTSDLTAVEMLRLVLADVREMKARLGALDGMESKLAALEALVEDRLKDTRPIWQAINARTERIEEALIDMKEQMGRLAYRDLEREAAQSRLASRVTEIENRARDGERTN